MFKNAATIIRISVHFEHVRTAAAISFLSTVNASPPNFFDNATTCSKGTAIIGYLNSVDWTT